jgi:hypothetical protein
MTTTAPVQATQVAQLPRQPPRLTLAPRLRPTLIQILTRMVGREDTERAVMVTGRVGMAGREVTREADATRLVPHIYYEGRWRVAMANISYGEYGPVELNLPALAHVARLNGPGR